MIGKVPRGSFRILYEGEQRVSGSRVCPCKYIYSVQYRRECRCTGSFGNSNMRCIYDRRQGLEIKRLCVGLQSPINVSRSSRRMLDSNNNNLIQPVFVLSKIIQQRVRSHVPTESIIYVYQNCIVLRFYRFSCKSVCIGQDVSFSTSERMNCCHTS